MKYRWLSKFLLAMCASAALAACGDDDGNDLKCADGTVKQGDQCVAAAPDGSTCAEGTTFEDGKCVPNAPDGSTCAEGTTFEDGKCVPNAPDGSICAAPTVFEDGNCVIKPDICDAGTQLDPNTNRCVLTDELCQGNAAIEVDEDGNTRCVPTDEVCDAGTSFDETSRLCVPDATCQENDVILNGVCVSPAEELAASADLTENPDENNDPTLGGTAEAFEVPAVGGQFVIAGIIGAPVDLDADGVADQDRDAFSFEAEAGDWFQISLQSTGLPAPAFVIDGPDGYYRQSFDGGAASTARQLVATESGTYTLTILPAAMLPGRPDAGPFGAADWGYVATVKAVDAPAPATVDLSGGPATISGELLDLSDNLFEITGAQAGDLVQLSATQTPRAASGLLETWLDATTLHEIHPLVQNDSYVLEMPAGDTLRVLMDWTRADSLATGFSLKAEVVGAAPTVTIAAGQSETVQVAAAHLDVLKVLYTSAGDDTLDVSVTNPGGEVIGTADDLAAGRVYQQVAFYDGTYTVEFTNSGENDVDATLRVSTQPPTDLGLLRAGRTTSTAPDSFLDADIRFFSFQVPAGHFMLAGQQNLEASSSTRYEFYDATGKLLDSSSSLSAENFSGGSYITDYSQNGGRYLLRMEASKDLWDWQLNLRTYPVENLGAAQSGSPLSNTPMFLPKGEKRVLSIEATEGQVIKLTHDNRTSQYVKLWVRDEATQKELTYDSSFYPQSHGSPEAQYFFVPADATYQIWVEGNQNTLDEKLTVETVDVDDAGDFSAGSTGSAIALALQKGEMKWVTFSTTQTGIMTVTHNNAEGNTVDLQVYGPGGNELAKETSVAAQSGSGSKKSVALITLAPGTYAALLTAKSDITNVELFLEMTPSNIVSMGTVAAGETVTTPPVDLIGDVELHYTFDFPAGTVARITHDNDASGSATVKGYLYDALGNLLMDETYWYSASYSSGPEYLTAYAKDAQSMMLHITRYGSSSSYDRPGEVAIAQAVVPEDHGVIQPTGAVEFSSTELIPKKELAYHKVTFDQAVVITGEITSSQTSGTNYVKFYDEDFNEVKSSSSGKISRAGLPAGTYILEVYNTSQEMADHTISLDVRPGYVLNP